METITELYNTEAEKAVLGAFYLNPELLYQVDFINTDFHSLDHRKIYTAMLTLFVDGTPPDYVNISNMDASIDKLRLLEILREAITAANVNYHAKIVKDLADKRRYRKELVALQGKVEDQDFLQQVEKTLLDLQENSRKKETSTVEILKSIHKDMEIAAGKDHVGVQTGFLKLNKHCVGLCKKHIWLLGGYTSKGKSTVLSQVISDTLDNGAKVLVFSVEDSAQDKIIRLMATRTGIPISWIVKGKLDTDQWTDITRAFAEISDFPLFVYDDCYTLDEIELKIKKHKIQGGIDVVAIDFVQNLITDGKSIYDRMSEVAIRLQRMAKKHDVCIFALSQISEGKDKESINLRGAQELASAPDIVLWIDRKQDQPEFNLIIRKNRPFGETGKIPMTFTNKWTGIKEV